jgi:AcrR family transcriptional regulator
MRPASQPVGESSSSSPPSSPSSAKALLLDAVIAHLGQHGLGDLSLRQLAPAVGTSHRMLIYHFGSKEGLLIAVVQEVEARQRAALVGFDLASADRPEDLVRGLWARLADPTLGPLERLFFELYGQALGGHPAFAPFLDGIVDSWIEPAARLGRRLGLAPAEARDEARLGLAVTRGLLLDLLATGDRAAVDRAMDRYIAGWSPPGSMRPATPSRKSQGSPSRRARRAATDRPTAAARPRPRPRST